MPRRSALAALHAPRSVLVPFLDRRFEPHLDQMQHVPVDDAPGDRLHQVPVRDRVEILRQIGVHHVRMPRQKMPVHSADRIARAPLGSVAMDAVLEIRLEDRLQHQFGGGLRHPVPNRGDAERAFAAARLRDRHPSHGPGPVGLRDEILAQPDKPPLHARRLDLLEVDSVHARRARVVAGQRIGVFENVGSANLVVEQVEAVVGLRLRLAIKLSLQAPDFVGRRQTHRQSPSFSSRQKRARSQGPWLRRNYPASTLLRPCPTPA